MPKIVICDASGNARTPTQIIACDATGTQRKVKQGWVGDESGVARLFFQPSIIFSITCGEGGVAPNVYAGYIAGQIGSLSPIVDVFGNTITELISGTSGGYDFAVLSISSSSELGANYFSVIESDNDVGLSASQAIEYGYSGGVNTWSWQFVNLALQPGEETTVEITYP